MTSQTTKEQSVLFAVAVTQFAVPFMISAVGVVLPSIGEDFHANGVLLSLVEAVFLGVNAMSLLCFGRASDLMGRNWIFTTGLSVFILATASLGFSPSIYALIAIRAVQALGGAMIVSTGLAILLSVFPQEERGKALGIALACVYLGLSAGPFLGGYIAGALGWRGVFFVGIIPCLVALLFILKTLPWDFRPSQTPFDIPGALASMTCIGLFLYGGANVDTYWGLLALGGFLVSFLIFLHLESRSPNPLLNLRLFTGSIDFSSGNLLQFLNYAATFGLTFLMSLYLQLGHGMSPMQAGTILVIQPLTQSILSPVCGRLADRYAPGIMVTVGMLMCICGLGWASTFDDTTALSSIYCMLGLVGLGIAFFVSPNMKMIMRSVDHKDYGVATAVTGQTRIVGMTVSMVAISMVISIVVGDKVLSPDTFPDFNQAMQLVLQGSCALGALGMAISLIVPAWNKHRTRHELIAGEHNA
ncbi:MFS transporter [Desulfovibrio inopinatus]|uniref:MFS transporter n=1 Tax=Desulfovibrio inopinatus TaxID=102109 RepID=UPI000426A97F|nr:MFS transporter [Desulfovibrio inopinatus]